MTSIHIQPVSEPDAPFCGQAHALARLHQHVTRPTHTGALTFIGRVQSGKTALLKRLPHLLDPTVYLGLYFDLTAPPFGYESGWINALYDAAYEAALGLGFSAERLPVMPSPPLKGADLRAWLADEGLPELLRVIRPHRRLVFLLDNADALIDGLETPTPALPTDLPAFLQALINEQVRFVLTANSENEARLTTLAPLTHPSEIMRLTNLTAEDIGGLFSPESVAQAVYRATGGEPSLVQAFWQVLWDEIGKSQEGLTPARVKAVSGQVYAQSEPFLRHKWTQALPHEQLALTALAHLTYENPLSPIPPQKIVGWLVDSDYPTDLTTVNVALRSLEYAEIVTVDTHGVRLKSGLHQAWLLEYARLTAPKTGAGTPFAGLSRRKLILAIVGAVLVLAILLVVIGGLPAPEVAGVATPPPTVTLGD